MLVKGLAANMGTAHTLELLYILFLGSIPPFLLA